MQSWTSQGGLEVQHLVHLQIQNESQSVASKTLTASGQIHQPYLSPHSQARDIFFAYHVTARCWCFLGPYHHQTSTPKELTLAIEAVSLAYLWHQVYSDSPLASAWKRYGLALRMINKAIGYPIPTTRDTTLMASFLLDLFEKVTNNDSEP